MKVMNKNKNGKHIIPSKEFHGMKKRIEDVDWFFELYEKLDKCLCGECSCK
jgi:hypothetical protein